MVKRASLLALDLRINPILIGLTIISIGTSAPEFLVCLIAALRESSDIATGNIVGSNIANIGLILGMTALIRPVRSDISLLRIEVPLMIALSVLLFVLSINLMLGRLEGSVIFLFVPLFLIYCYMSDKKYMDINSNGDDAIQTTKAVKNLLLLIVGLVMLVIGANLLVESSVEIARDIGISELVIGVTAVAVGTSLPELSASLIALYRREHGLVIGNIIGSNIFNLGILGLVSVIQPVVINRELLNLHYPAMILLSIVMMPFLRSGRMIGRIEGIFLLAVYAGFIYLIF